MSSLKEFEFFLQKPNTPYSLTTTRQTIASICMNKDDDDVIVLAGSIGWIATLNEDTNNFSNSGSATKADVIFEIWHGKVGEGLPIYIAKESAQAFDNSGLSTFDNICISSLDHVETGDNGEQHFHLTARTEGSAEVTIIGPLTFTGTAVSN